MSVVNQPMPQRLTTRTIQSPLGMIEIGVNDCIDNPSLWFVEFVSEDEPSQRAMIKEPSAKALLILNETERQLNAYFSREPYNFDRVLEFQSEYGTDFQRSVWQGLTTIPHGHTWSYLQLANHIGNPKAVRAVGAANGKNPLAIIVPCHRVIGANGSLTGYAGGLAKKQQLLEFEQSQTCLFMTEPL